MDRPVRIGIAGLDDRGLQDALRELPSRPETRRFASLYDETERLVADRPDVLFVDAGAGDEAADLPGALRLLRALVPGLPVVVIAPAAREVEVQPLCRRAGAHLLLAPFRRGAVAAVLEQALTGSDRPRDEVFHDLARGFADEINNPLLFLSGHLQLLQTRLDTADKDRRDQVEAALLGAARIQATVERVRFLSRAASGPRNSEAVDLHAGLLAALGRGPDRRAAPAVLREPENARFLVTGDRELLEPALELFAQVAAGLHELGCHVHFVLTRVAAGIRLRLRSSGQGMADWRLPQTYEPYYLNRLLPGSGHGLSLFLVQTTVHAHHGQATARRLPDGALALDLLFPAAE